MASNSYTDKSNYGISSSGDLTLSNQKVQMNIDPTDYGKDRALSGSPIR